MRTVATGGRPNALVGLLVVGALLACSPSAPLNLPPTSCQPGAQTACACPGGGSSVQVCGTDRVLGPCQCSGADGGTDSAIADELRRSECQRLRGRARDEHRPLRRMRPCVRGRGGMHRGRLPDADLHVAGQRAAELPAELHRVGVVAGVLPVAGRRPADRGPVGVRRPRHRRSRLPGGATTRRRHRGSAGTVRGPAPRARFRRATPPSASRIWRATSTSGPWTGAARTRRAARLRSWTRRARPPGRLAPTAAVPGTSPTRTSCAGRGGSR